MTLGDYIFYSVCGIVVVFCALILLMLVIKVLTYVAALIGKKEQEANKKTNAPSLKNGLSGAATQNQQGANAQSVILPNEEKPLAPGSAGGIKLYDTDPRDAAMLMAIVANELQKPLNELRFISIREVKK